MQEEDQRVPDNTQTEGDLVLTPGETLVVSREDFQNPGNYNDPKEEALEQFLRVIAQDPNIEGVAISRINCGGIYTDWFVRDLSVGEKGRNSLEVTGNSYRLLEEAAGDQAGYGSFMHLGERSFEEAEAHFRANWSVVDENSPFNMGAPHGEDLELLGIIRFE